MRGVQFYRANRTWTISARREVILSAGAINSPQILMLSGIGRKDHLESFGIKVLKDLSVGDNLQVGPVVHRHHLPFFVNNVW